MNVMVGAKEQIPGVVYMRDDILNYYVDEGLLGDQTLVDAFRAAAAQFPERVAVSEIDELITYRELDEATDRAAAAMLRIGLRRHDRVIFQIINSKELVIAFLACLKAGLIPICTLAAHRSSEIGQIGRQASAKAHIVSAHAGSFDLVEFAAKMRAEIPSIDHVIAVGGDEDTLAVRRLEDMIAAESLEDARSLVGALELDPFQVAVFQLSGGTTGVPKIIPRFHNDYLCSMRSVIAFHSFDETLVAFTANPMMHNAPLLCFWGPALFFGGEVAIAPSSDVEAVGQVIAKRCPNWAVISPVHLRRLSETGILNAQSFRNVYGLATPSGAPSLKAALNAPVVHLYGMTEGLLTFGRPDDSDLAIELTVGQSTLIHDEIRLVIPGTTEDVPPGGIGELIVRGPCTISGYFDSPQRNMEAFTIDGYYRSGDLMSFCILDSKRYLRFEGRVKDVVDRAGEKINCSEVETAIGRLAGVANVACVGMPDPVYGERLCAFIIVEAGTRALTVADIAVHLGEVGLAKFKYPERVEIVTEFPVTPSGKPSKPLLKDHIIRLLACKTAEAGA